MKINNSILNRMKSIDLKASPFLKWAGGKKQLLPKLFEKIPKIIKDGTPFTYIEPFLGSGAVFFKIIQDYNSSIINAVINDINPILMALYKNIKSQPVELISILKELKREYLSLGTEDKRAEYFYNVRAKFNNLSKEEIEKSALMIFLNKTCFNGLYRENKSGQFNVPHGRYKNPEIFNENQILKTSNLLQKVTIMNSNFEDIDVIDKDSLTLYYLDPPYKPISKTSNFNSYTNYNFDDFAQQRLKEYCDKITEQKSFFILSNSDLKNIDESNNYFDNLYNKYDIERVLATRMINSNSNKRGKIFELIITNEKLIH